MTNFRTSKSVSAVKSNLVALLQAINSDVDVSQGQVIKDLVIDAPAEEFGANYVLLDYVNAIKSLDGILLMLKDATFLQGIADALEFTSVSQVTALISADLDALGSNWNVTRNPATPAKYTQRFYRVNDVGGPYTVPLGTTVQTRDGSAILETITSTSQALQQEPETGLWFVEETVQAQTAGTSGNVAALAISVISPAITDFTLTANMTVVSAGTDAESDTAFAARIKDVFKQTGINTVNGYRSLMMAVPVSAQDALVVKPGDALMTRSPAGAVDIYLVGKNLASAREVITYRSGTTQYLLAFQPVEAITTVLDAAAAVVNPANYTLVKDATTEWKKSVRAGDIISFSDVTGLVDTQTFTVQYTYDKRVRDGQNLVDTNESTAVPGSDVLVRQGTQVVIDVTAQIVTFGSRTLSDVQADIQADFAKFLNGGTATTGAVYAAKRLGEDIDQSDIITVIASVDDVDRVTLTNFVVKKDTVAQGDPVPVAANEYARVGTVTFI